MNGSIRNEMVPRRVRGSGRRMQMEQFFQESIHPDVRARFSQHVLVRPTGLR
jgi:hypothetical protein